MSRTITVSFILLLPYLRPYLFLPLIYLIYLEAKQLGVEFINFDMTKELPSTQIDCFFWKSPPPYDSNDETDILTVQRFNEFISGHPWIHMIGPIDGTTNFRDHMKKFFSDLAIDVGDTKIRQPSWQYLSPNDDTHVNLEYPLVAKPRHALNHTIALIYNQEGLKEYRSQLPNESFTLEEFKNHDSVMHKLYFLGKKCWVYYRKSFDNITSTTNEEGKNFEIPSTRISQEITNSEGNLAIPNPLPNEALTEIRNYITRKDPSLSMFGIDIIQDVTSKIYYIIDINFAPSYAEVPQGPSLLLNHILSGTLQRFSRPHNNAVFLPEPRSLSSFSRESTIVVFDIDGTITENGLVITDQVRETLQKLRQVATVGVISGGTIEQVGTRLGPNFLNDFDYVFGENSCQSYHNAKLVDPYTMEAVLTRKEIIEMINWCLIYIANLDLPLKRGLFIDYREGLINVSPAGRWTDNIAAREEWIAFDRKHGIRKKMVDDMKAKFGHWNKLSWVIGGNSGFDVFPQGWDKSLVHRFTSKYTNYYYFGDKTDPAAFGNDWPCFSHITSFGFSVKDPEDTINIVKKCFCLA